MEFKEKIEKLREALPVIKEYPENLQIQAFDYLLMENHTKMLKCEIEEPTLEVERTLAHDAVARKHKKRATVQSSSYTNSYNPQLVKDLNLRPSANKSLAEFFEEKRPDGNIQNSAVMAYYLQHILGLEDISPDHIFTCYRELNKKIPAVIIQNLRDCSSSRYGYINFNNGKITTSIKGINFVEQDLPHKRD